MSAAHILVVDDEADIRSLLKEILSEEGYEVDVAGDAGQARASRARQPPDLVLLDIWMPDVDGITLLREWSAPAGRVVLPGGHDVRPRHRRDRGRGHAPRRVRLRREAAVAAEAAAHRRARAGGRQAQAPGRQVVSRVAAACRSARAASCSSCAPSCSRSRATIRRCCWSASPAPGAKRSRASSTSRARAPRGRSSR